MARASSSITDSRAKLLPVDASARYAPCFSGVCDVYESVLTFGQYVLDMFGSVAEAVEILGRDEVRITPFVLPNGQPAGIHMSLSDPTGDSAIFEWLDGSLTIHHDRRYRVMTNSPPFDEQLAIAKYWQGVDPLTFLPGSINAADRFARVSFFIEAIP